MNTTTGIIDAVAAAGSQQKLADTLGVSQQAVAEWVKRGYAPITRLVDIEAQYGIPRVRLINPKYSNALTSPHFTEV